MEPDRAHSDHGLPDPADGLCGAEQLYTGAVEGIGDIASEVQQDLGATRSAQGHGDSSISRAT